MNPGGFPQDAGSDRFNLRGPNCDGGIEPYPANQQQGNTMFPHPSGFGMMPQQSSGSWGMDQQPGNMMPQQMNLMWMPPQPSKNSLMTEETNLGMSQHGSMTMGHQGVMNMGQQGRLNMSQQINTNMGQQFGMNMGQQGGMPIGQQNSMNIGQQGGMHMGQQNNMNMGQQGGMHMSQQDNMNMGRQGGMHMSQQDNMNMGQQGSMHMGQQDNMNMGQQNDMNMVFQSGMNSAYPGGKNTSSSSINMAQQSSMTMGQQSGMTMGQQSMNMAQQGSLIRPQQSTLNTGLPQQSGLNVMNTGSFRMPPQPGANFSGGISSAPGQNTYFTPNSSAQMMQQGGACQPGIAGPGFARGMNNSSGFQQENQVNKTSFQQPTVSHSSSGANTHSIGDKLDEFYASIKAKPPNEVPSQHPPSSDVDQQSSTVSSSIDSCSTDLQRTIGLKLMEISSQIGTGKSTLGKGSMSKAVSENLKTTIPQEPDSSTSTSIQQGPSTAPSSSADTKLSGKFADDDTDYCKLCNIYFTSHAMYAFHVRGVTHIQRLMAVEAGVDRKPADKPFIISGRNFTQTNCGKHIAKNPSNERKTTENTTEDDYSAHLYCDVCEIHLNSEAMLWKHMSGKKHIRAVKAMHGEKPLLQEMKESKKNWHKEHAEEGESNFDNFLLHLPPDEPVVGLQYVVEIVVGNEEVYLCELCNAQCYRNNMIEHVIGIKHRLAYLKSRNRNSHELLTKRQQKLASKNLCMELEKSDGRGKPRYIGPPKKKKPVEEAFQPTRDDYSPPVTRSENRRQQQDMSNAEKNQAIESLKRILLDDFRRRNIETELAHKILESRLELLREYERRGVPFVVARERVIEEEERWNLLLEFERQILPFEEAEQRIDHRFQLMKMYEKNGYPSEEARRKRSESDGYDEEDYDFAIGEVVVAQYQEMPLLGLQSDRPVPMVLDDEVIHDFRHEFQQLGLRRDQAKKLAEKRLWLLETLHYQGLTPEEASHKVITIEQELKDSLILMQEDEQTGARGGGSHDSKAARWMVIGEELEQFVVGSCKELGLTAGQSQAQLKVVQESLERYKEKRISPEEAKCRVLVDDLSTPEKIAAASSPPPSNPTEEQPVETATHDPGSQADISHRVQQFLSKMKSAMQTLKSSDTIQREEKKPKEPETEAEREKQLEEYDQQSRLEIQNLLSEMLQMNIPADEARKRLEALYKQHENLRKNLFPAKKNAKASVKTDKPSAAKKLQEKEMNLSQQPSKETQLSKENNTEEGKSSKPKESSHKAEVTSEREKPHRVAKNKDGSSSSQKTGKESSSTKDSRKDKKDETSKRSREEHSRRSRSKDKQSSRQRHARRSRSKDKQSSRQGHFRRSRSRQSKDRKSPRQSRRSASRDSRGHSKRQEKKDKSADDRWNSSVEMFLQQYGLKKDEFHSHSSRRHSHDRYSPSDLSPRTSRQKTSIRDRDHWPLRGRHRTRSQSKSRSQSSLSKVQTMGIRRFRSRSGSAKRKINVFKRASRSRSRSRVSREHHWQSPSVGYRSRLMSIERELNKSPDFSRKSPLLPHHRRRIDLSPDKQGGWSAYKQRGWSPEKERDWSPDKERGWSPDKQRCWSPDKQRGWSPAKHRGWSPEKQRGWSPERQRSLERQRSPEPHRSPPRRRGSDFNKYPPKYFGPHVAHNRRPQRSPTPSPERGNMQRGFIKSRRDDYDKYAPSSSHGHHRRQSPSPFRQKSPSFAGSDDIDSLDRHRVQTPLKKMRVHRDRNWSRSPPRGPHFSFHSGVWDDEETEDLGKYQDW